MILILVVWYEVKVHSGLLDSGLMGLANFNLIGLVHFGMIRKVESGLMEFTYVWVDRACQRWLALFKLSKSVITSVA